jgi:hypothetical protein
VGISINDLPCKFPDRSTVEQPGGIQTANALHPDQFPLIRSASTGEQRRRYRHLFPDVKQQALLGVFG